MIAMEATEQDKAPLQVGRWYWVAAQGPMKILELPDPPKKTTIKLMVASGGLYWASPQHVGSLVTEEAWQTYEREMRAHGLPFVRPEDSKE